ALAHEHYGWEPISLLLRHRMPVSDFIRGSAARTAVIVASRDTIVPARRSAALREVVPNPAFERTIEAGHNDLYDRRDFAEALREAVGAVLQNGASRRCDSSSNARPDVERFGAPPRAGRLCH